ncbi:hypothetical protein BC938DRAFT_477828 [Jimgerdemannia flammicorona]|uniref:ER membrane protein complex subunit 4 n=1 Tax=Jimgerdemannia flammicorona TaxID=994334 RepID=A0A433QYR0_9FUNG|nr:hypothetical protein BC938DRAFT_477828 [Jimgerdemannia flammicorona]
MSKRYEAQNKWTVDFATLEPVSQTIMDPPGFAHAAPGSLSKTQQKSVKAGANQDDFADLKVKKAWDAAMAAGKAIPMQAFMMWMTGNGVQIFSVMFTVMLFWQPFKAIANISQGIC